MIRYLYGKLTEIITQFRFLSGTSGEMTILFDETHRTAVVVATDDYQTSVNHTKCVPG